MHGEWVTAGYGEEEFSFGWFSLLWGIEARPRVWGMKVAVFFERDGILTNLVDEGGHFRTAQRMEEFRLRDGVATALSELRRAGFLLFATTNQPGVTAGTPSRRELELMHTFLSRKLGLDGVLVCPHPLDDSCTCRKPLPGLLKEAAHQYKLDLEHSFVVSDRWEDAEMADAVGATSVLVRAKANGNGHHDYIVADFAAAVAKVIEVAGSQGTLRVLHEQKH